MRGRDPEDGAAQARALIAAAREGRRDEALAPLEDRAAWRAASPAAQDAVIGRLADELRPAFSLLGAEPFSCAGERHRIARFRHARSGLILHLLPGDTLHLGDPDAPPEMRREVRLGPLLIGATPVPQAAWDALGGDDTRRWRDPQRPIEGCSHEAARRWLARAGDGLRLPSEAEWEYACRAGTRGRWCCGDDPERLRDFAWLRAWPYDAAQLAGGPPAVGLKAPNAFGLRDIHGSVFEWTADAWLDELAGGPADGSPRELPGSELRVARGGAWRSQPERATCAHRCGFPKDHEMAYVGLRAARSIASSPLSAPPAPGGRPR